MIQQIIGSVATVGTVLLLVGIIFKLKSKEIEDRDADRRKELKMLKDDFKEAIQDMRADFMEALRTLHDEKVNKEACVLKHESNEEKFKIVFDKLDDAIGKINGVATDVAVIKKGVNGKNV